MAFPRDQTESRENEEEEETAKEGVDPHDNWDELRDQDRVENLVDTPVPITTTEILDLQRMDGLFKEIISNKYHDKSRFVETKDGELSRVPPGDVENLQIEMPEVLRPMLLNLTHHWKTVGHPRQNGIYATLKNPFYWARMSEYVANTKKTFATFARNRIKMRKRTNPIKLFYVLEPLVSISADILGPLTKYKSGRLLFLVINERF